MGFAFYLLDLRFWLLTGGLLGLVYFRLGCSVVLHCRFAVWVCGLDFRLGCRLASLWVCALVWLVVVVWVVC